MAESFHSNSDSSMDSLFNIRNTIANLEKSSNSSKFSFPSFSNYIPDNDELNQRELDNIELIVSREADKVVNKSDRDTTSPVLSTRSFSSRLSLRRENIRKRSLSSTVLTKQTEKSPKQIKVEEIVSVSDESNDKLDLCFVSQHLKETIVLSGEEKSQTVITNELLKTKVNVISDIRISQNNNAGSVLRALLTRNNNAKYSNIIPDYCSINPGPSNIKIKEISKPSSSINRIDEGGEVISSKNRYLTSIQSAVRNKTRSILNDCNRDLDETREIIKRNLEILRDANEDFMDVVRHFPVDTKSEEKMVLNRFILKLEGVLTGLATFTNHSDNLPEHSNIIATQRNKSSTSIDRIGEGSFISLQNIYLKPIQSVVLEKTRQLLVRCDIEIDKVRNNLKRNLEMLRDSYEDYVGVRRHFPIENNPEDLEEIDLNRYISNLEGCLTVLGSRA